MPCCIDRMRFSPRFSIRKLKSLIAFYFSFFCQVWDLFVFGDGLWVRGFFDLAKNEKLVCCSRSIAVPSRFHSSGGSSAVEQRTVKCASAAILWSGVQISLSGFFVWNFQIKFPEGIFHFCIALVIRSYHGESTASHPNCEVKHRWAGSVLR